MACQFEDIIPNDQESLNARLDIREVKLADAWARKEIQ